MIRLHTANSSELAPNTKTLYGKMMDMIYYSTIDEDNCDTKVTILARNEKALDDLMDLTSKGDTPDSTTEIFVNENRENILVGLPCDSIMEMVISAKDPVYGFRKIDEVLDLFDYIEIRSPKDLCGPEYEYYFCEEMIKIATMKAFAKGIPVMAVSDKITASEELEDIFGFLGDASMKNVVFESPEKIAEMCTLENPDPERIAPVYCFLSED